MKFYLVETFLQLASPAVVLDRTVPLIRQSRTAGLRSKYPQVVKVMRLLVTDFIEARAMAMDGKLRRSFLSDRLELRLLLVA
jgi:hypothetical protein